MSETIRVICGERSAYIPVNSEYQSRLERFAAAGLADISNGIVMLKSDAGPLFWEMLGRTFKKEESNPLKAIAALGDDSIRVAPDEELSFGKKDNFISYSHCADLTISKQAWKQDGINLSLQPLSDGMIVMTAWTKEKKIVPARVFFANRRFGIEVVEAQPKDERCFILDEKCDCLLSASFPSTGKEKIMLVNPAFLDSWLCASKSDAIMKLSHRFTFHVAEGTFTIGDKKTGKKYVGQFKSAVSELEELDFEKIKLERALSSKGLGAVLPNYILVRG